MPNTLIRSRGLIIPRLDPTRVPDCPVELDRTHPLAAGTTGLYLFGAPSYLTDLAGTLPRAAQGAAPAPPNIVTTAIGPGLGFNGSTNSLLVGVAPPLQTATFTYSAVVLLNTSGYYHPIVGSTSNGGVEWRCSNLGQELLAEGVASYGQYGGAVPVNAVIKVALTLGAGVVSHYRNGTLVGSGAASPSFSYSGVTIGCGYEGQTGAQGEFWSGQIMSLQFFNAVLPPSRIAYLHAEPFGMLRPVARRVWAFASVAAAHGSLAIAESADAISAATRALARGSLAQAEAADAVSATARALASGSVAATEAPDTVSARGAALARATLAGAEAADALSGSARARAAGSLRVAELADLISASAIVVSSQVPGGPILLGAPRARLLGGTASRLRLLGGAARTRIIG